MQYRPINYNLNDHNSVHQRSDDDVITGSNATLTAVAVERMHGIAVPTTAVNVVTGPDTYLYVNGYK
ncbi:MAG: hypothetical protein IPQ04_11230 [Saprospiraceae bacterium]|nr:hypothetical protein [Saprospiraceae bacterium]